jgi:hypothetical protein
VDLEFGPHARLRLLVPRITETEVQQVVEEPERVEQGRDQIRIYRAEVAGRGLVVVLAHDQEPPYVVTVMIEG